MSIQYKQLLIEQEELRININKYRSQYAIDKKGWVTYKTGRKKKLRAYVVDLARMLSKLNDDSFYINRKLLIQYYNKDGIAGINRAAQIAVSETVK